MCTATLLENTDINELLLSSGGGGGGAAPAGAAAAAGGEDKKESSSSSSSGSSSGEGFGLFVSFASSVYGVELWSFVCVCVCTLSCMSGVLIVCPCVSPHSHNRTKHCNVASCAA